MKKHWELFWNSFWISFKHSSLRLLCLLCVLLLCTALLTVFFRSLPQNPAPEKAKVGIINLDGNAFSVSMMRMALGDAGLSDMIETTDLPPDEESRTEYKEAQYDLLADTLRRHLDMEAIYQMMEQEGDCR